jgi:hypothetical protein
MSAATWIEEKAHHLEALAWTGLASSAAVVATGAQALSHHVSLYATVTPQDVVTWTQAICTAISVLTGCINGVAIIVKRFGKPVKKQPRKPRKKADGTTPKPAADPAV